MNSNNTLQAIIADFVQTLGTFEQFNLIRYIYKFDDPRILIIGMCPLNLVGKFESLSVRLKITPQKRDIFSDLPYNALLEDMTTVYYAVNNGKGLVETVYRPGLWEKFIRQQHAELEKDRHFNSRLNGVPIDDTVLFPEINSPDNST